MKRYYEMQRESCGISDIDFVKVTRGKGYRFSYTEGRDKHGFIFVQSGRLEYSFSNAERAEEKTVTVDGEPVSLTPMEYSILKLLMESPGKVYSSAQIYGSVWNDNGFGSESAVAVHIRHLREKIEINPSEPRYLKVVWGQGYKMERL